VTELPVVAPGCPKHMVFGPCGGVREDGGCEMRPAAPCVFDALVRWPGDRYPGTTAGSLPGLVADPQPVGSVPVAVPPLVLTDLSAPPADAATLRSTARTLAPSCDAVLVGDHQDRPDFSPSLLARLLRDSGSHPWVTLACRDRNRVMLEQELLSHREDGPVTVLCVTGDGRAFDVRPDVTQVFDLDGTRLAALARSIGLPVAVAESPRSRPLQLRPLRLVEKERAGATVAVLNHVGSVAAVAEFVAAAVGAGLTIPVLASVPVYTDQRSAEVLAALPGLEMDPAAVRRVLGSADPVSAGIETATALAGELLDIAGVAGVNLSGMASARGVAFAASVQAEIGTRIGEEHARGRSDGG
jgi:methylenetetrahydrofolate reductase (NADPH)